MFEEPAEAVRIVQAWADAHPLPTWEDKLRELFGGPGPSRLDCTTKDADPCKGYEKCKSYRPDCQTNADRIRAMSDEQMVRTNIRLSYRCDIDYDYDGKPYENWKQYYETSDGSAFYEEKDAVEYELDWLRQPAEGEQHES